MKRYSRRGTLGKALFYILLVIVIALLVAFAIRLSKRSVHTHTDEDGDYHCDSCGELIEHEHTDAKDSNGYCDLCGEQMPTAPPGPHEHTDGNGDYHCDSCGELIEHEHTDAKDSNGYCDLCGEQMPTAPPGPHEHTDGNGDYHCDSCGELIEHEHTDAKDSNGYCDLCGERMPTAPPTPQSPSIRFEDGEDDIVFEREGVDGVFLSTDHLILVPTRAGEQLLNVSAAENLAVSWSVSWEDSGAEWAQGKEAEEYVSVQPALGTYHATVRLLAPFGARIRITATVGKQAVECIADCLKAPEVYRGYVNVWNEHRANPYFGYDTFHFHNSRLDRRLTPEYRHLEEVRYFPYTLEQELTWNMEKSTVSLTQEFLDSFVPFALESELLNDALSAHISSLRADTVMPMLYEGEGRGDYYLICGGWGYGFDFPLLSEGLSTSEVNGEGDRYLMGQILDAWFETDENAQIAIVEANYYFDGSVSDVTMTVRQRGYAGRLRPEEYDQE